MKKIFFLITIFSFSAFLPAQINDYPLVKDPSSSLMNVPAGWILTGTNVKDYETGIDNNERMSGTSSGYLKSSSAKPLGYATLLQEIKADNYRGERIRLSVFAKTKLLSDWAAIWMKVEDQYRRILSFDNMQNRLLVGTSDWKKIEIVLDVPFNSEVITYGATLSGKGQIWFDDIKILTVTKETALTDMLISEEKKFYPVNPDFEE
jgi:hypothetical protein